MKVEKIEQGQCQGRDRKEGRRRRRETMSARGPVRR